MPKHLNSRCKQLVANLLDYFHKELVNQGPLLPLTAVRERVAAALQLNPCTVSTISMQLKNKTVLQSPPKKRSHPKRITDVVNFDVSGIRNSIYEMYKNKDHVTLSTIHKKLEERQLFTGSQRSLYSVLHTIGFKWSKDNPRRGLMELPHVAFKRVQFLRKYFELKNEALYQFVYLDETWIFQNGTIGRSWQDQSRKTVKATKIDGKRYIILHAGNENGFIPGTELVFGSKTLSEDYHGEMNQKNFTLWFEEQLLKNLSEPSAIVVDNASYHNVMLDKVPNSCWKKNNVQNWLTKHNIEFSENALKSELLGLVSRNKPPVTYVIDELAEKYGHTILRLPPYHCIFNAIELVWGITKSYYNKHVGKKGNSVENCLETWRAALKTVTPEIWAKCIKHTDAEITKWYERERILDIEEIAPIIINVHEEDDTESSSDSDCRL